MSKKSVLVIAAITVTVALIAKGGDDVAALVVTVVLVGVACYVVLLMVWIRVTNALPADRELTPF